MVKLHSVEIALDPPHALKPLPLYEQLLALPENLTGEILNGELYTQPRSSGRHGIAERGLNIDIGGPFDFGRGGPGGWWIVPQPEVHFVRDTEVAVPDLAGWRRERMPAIPDDHRFEVVPDWVCEILSPATAKKDRILKLPLYARHGVAHAWLVDPLARTLEAFELRGGAWLLIATLKDDDAVSVPPFDAVSFSLADLWA
ncbi:MAG: Uma2 family endonuclease [Gammaproteobacteria bacterium]